MYCIIGIPLSPADAKQRIQFFEGLLVKLHLAANSGYSSLKNQCHDTQATVNATYPNLPKFPDISMLHVLEQDSYSKTVIPLDVPERLVPLKCYGDGNCLFRYMNIINFIHLQIVQ